MSFLHDLKIAVRSLARARALWITVALTLALGIGANAAIFSIVRAVLLRPARQSRRKPAALHAPERSGHRRNQHRLLGTRDSGHRPQPQDHQGTRHLLRDRLHRRRPRHAARNPRRRRRRQLLRGDGPAPGARPPAHPRRRWPQRRRRHRAHLSVLAQLDALRSQRAWQDRAA